MFNQLPLSNKSDLNLDTQKRKLLFILLFCSMLFVVGCDDMGKAVNRSAVTPASNIVATVNGEPITDNDVQLALERMFSRSSDVTVNGKLRGKVLQSLIASRAMKLLAISKMSDKEIDKIKGEAKAYEEELFVKRYLQLNVNPAPVTAEMVEQYYHKHPDEFVSQTLMTFEMLSASADLNEKKRDKILNRIDDIRHTNEWSKSAKQWQSQLALEYTRGQSRKGLLDEKLGKTLASLEQGETSDVIYLGGKLYLLRLLNVSKSTVKSLAEVSGDIRKELAPMLLREAVKKASEQARSQVSVSVANKGGQD